MRPKVPLAYAALLVIALVAVVGFAAFSPSTASPDESADAATSGVEKATSQMSARVASAVLAVRVSDAGARTATTQTDAPATDTNTANTETTTTVAHEDSEDAAADVETDTVTIDAAEETTTTAPAAVLQSEPADTTPPKFTISSPHDGDTVNSRIVTIKGTVEKGATVKSGPFQAKVNDDGTWSIDLALAEGANGASLTATDGAGNSSSTRIVINYKAPTTTTKAPPTTKATTTTAPHTDSTPTTTAPHTDSTPTTTKPPSSSSSSSKYSSLWPADAGGIRNVEQWRPLVQKYWASDRVDCVLGIIQRESKGDPTAYNSTYGASGLMQHLIKYWPSRAASAGFKDSSGKVASPFNGEANIAAGAAIAGSGSKWYTPWSRLPSYGSCSG